MKEKPGISVHTCNARNLGGWGRRVMSLMPAWATQWDLASKTPRKQKDPWDNLSVAHLPC
jgi:hypothetical protein